MVNGVRTNFTIRARATSEGLGFIITFLGIARFVSRLSIPVAGIIPVDSPHGTQVATLTSDTL
jgi:hypothetical protein